MSVQVFRNYFSIAVCLTILCVLSGCNRSVAEDKRAPSAMPPPTVGVIEAHYSDVMIAKELPGRLEASREAQIRARVPGIVEERLFTEGSMVKKGQKLFQIDDAPFAADLRSAKAGVLQAEANLVKAAADVKRFRPLVKANAVSKQQFDTAVAAEKLAQAALQNAQAVVENAKIRLDYASVTAPISGRIGRAYVTEGALVGQADPKPMAIIQQTDPMYVNITQSASEILQMRQAVAKGQADLLQSAEAEIILDDGSRYPYKAKLLFTDVSVDPATGQVNLRAEVENSDDFLLPGLYVRVNLPQTRIEHAMLIPKQAVTRNKNTATVMVVDNEGGFAPKEIKIAGEQDQDWIVTGGLNDKDLVIVDGMQKLRGAKKVQTTVWRKHSETNQQAAEQATTQENKQDSK